MRSSRLKFSHKAVGTKVKPKKFRFHFVFGLVKQRSISKELRQESQVSVSVDNTYFI